MQKKFCFYSQRGEKLCGVLNLPRKQKPPYPVVVFSHGFLAAKHTLFAPFWARGLARQGLAVFRFDLPGHGSSGGNKEDVTVLRNIEDVSSAIDFIQDDKDLDLKNLAVAGHSYGAIAALLSPVYDERVKAVISMGGALNFKVIMENLIKTGKVRREGDRLFYNFVPLLPRQKCHESLLSYSESFDFHKWVEKVKVPVLLLHGKKDKAVPPYVVKETYNELETDKRLVQLPFAGHLFLEPWNQYRLIKETGLWLREKFNA